MEKDHSNALGLVETRGLVAAIEAADAMVKASEVRLLRIENTVAALMTVQVTGETAAVQFAVDAGVAAASRIGEVVASHVIPRPSSDVARLQQTIELPSDSRKVSRDRDSAPTRSLSSMTVRELRALARRSTGISLQGREIARASKKQLLAALSGLER